MKAELIDYMGNDLRVVNAARVSFDKESKQFEGKDERLIKYLAREGHWTPFAQVEIQLRETIPIFIARQRFKHGVGFVYNEVSRRYVDDTPAFYWPDAWRTRPDGSVKQGSGDGYVQLLHDGEEVFDIDQEYAKHISNTETLYRRMIENNVAPEQARMIIPQSMYTSYYVKGSLAAFARAYNQRIDSHAQLEIQELAKEWDRIIRPLFPVSWKELTK